MSITHSEVRRHPRWREEQNTPSASPRLRRLSVGRMLALVGLLILFATLGVLMLSR